LAVAGCWKRIPAQAGCIRILSEHPGKKLSIFLEFLGSDNCMVSEVRCIG